MILVEKSIPIMNSNVAFDDVKSNITKDELMSCFIIHYGQLPYAGRLSND